MTQAFQILFSAATAAGFVLPFLAPGAWPWWDSVWIFFFFVMVYADLARRLGLSAARTGAGIVILTMAVLLGAAGFSGSLNFTENAGLQIGGAIPLVLPLLAFAMLTVSGQAAESAFPGAGRTALALATTAAFLLSVLNGLTFFSTNRIWWEWNPENAPGGMPGLLLLLAIASFALISVCPADSHLKRSRWNAGLLAWLGMNTLFLVAHLPRP